MRCWSRDISISLNFSTFAQRETFRPLPVEELRAFTEVFARIKSEYVEPVEDKKLITQAISGMLAGLDPHSGFLDKEAFREMQVGTRGEFGGLGIEVGMEDGFVDLRKHLNNDRNQDPAPVAAVPTGNAFNFTPAARPQGVDEKDLKPEPGEVVAKSDYELAQAIAFLKSRGGVRMSTN